MNKRILILALSLLLSGVVSAQLNLDWVAEIIKTRVGDVTLLILCAIWYLMALITTLIMIIAGVKCLTSGDTAGRNMAIRRVIYSVIGLIIIIVACPVVNYLVHGTQVEEFRCECIPKVTTTSTTTTLPWVPPTSTTSTSTSTTTTTSTSTTSTTTIPIKGARFFMVGGLSDVDGIMLDENADVVVSQFDISGIGYLYSIKGGSQKFFICSGAIIKIYDVYGTFEDEIDTGATTGCADIAYGNGEFYVVYKKRVRVYDLDGNLLRKFSTIANMRIMPSGGRFNYPMAIGDTAYGGGRLFFVWKDGNEIKEVIYLPDGTLIRDETVIGTSSQTPRIAFGNRRFFVVASNHVWIRDPSGDPVTDFSTHIAYSKTPAISYGEGGEFILAGWNGKFEIHDSQGNLVYSGNTHGHGDTEPGVCYGSGSYGVMEQAHGVGPDGVGTTFLRRDGSEIKAWTPFRPAKAEKPGRIAYEDP